MKTTESRLGYTLHLVFLIFPVFIVLYSSYYALHSSDIFRLSYVGFHSKFRFPNSKFRFPDSGTRQFILKMSSEYQTVDHTSKVIQNDHDTEIRGFV
jgi:hypothetical protein